jgi:carbamoyltransferase
VPKKTVATWVLGLVGPEDTFHDNSAVLVKNGLVVGAISEERLSRLKHDRRFPTKSIAALLTRHKLKPSQITAVAIGYPPRAFWRAFAGQASELWRVVRAWQQGRGTWQWLQDVWGILNEERMQAGSGGLSASALSSAPSVAVDHHLAHAASAFYTAGERDALCISLDAFGVDTRGNFWSGVVYEGRDGVLSETPLEQLPIAVSVGLFYTSVTMALGFTPGDGEGKTMGLAAYGDPKPAYKALKKLAPSYKKGTWSTATWWGDQFFANRKSFRPIFSQLPTGKALQAAVDKYGAQDVAAAAQQLIEETVVAHVKDLLKKYPHQHLALSGGLFLNVKLNKLLMELPEVASVYVQPHAGDGGTALGAALIVSERLGARPAKRLLTSRMAHADLGLSYTPAQIRQAAKRFGKAVVLGKPKDISKYVADRLAEGVVIGWFQGGFEWGPRALGFRSVLIDPRRMDIKERLNLTLKNREWFMPFAPSVLDERGAEYFKDYRYSPYMTLAFDVVPAKVRDIQAAIHIDKTARPNSVTKTNNPAYHNVLKAFEAKTGIGVVLNTSFNKHGLPVISSPTDAIEHLLWNCVDELAIGPYVIKRAGVV